MFAYIPQICTRSFKAPAHTHADIYKHIYTRRFEAPAIIEEYKKIQAAKKLENSTNTDKKTSTIDSDSGHSEAIHDVLGDQVMKNAQNDSNNGSSREINDPDNSSRTDGQTESALAGDSGHVAGDKEDMVYLVGNGGKGKEEKKPAPGPCGYCVVTGVCACIFMYVYKNRLERNKGTVAYALY
jgi:hypothetical protein